VPDRGGSVATSSAAGAILKAASARAFVLLSAPEIAKEIAGTVAERPHLAARIAPAEVADLVRSVSAISEMLPPLQTEIPRIVRAVEDAFGGPVSIPRLGLVLPDLGPEALQLGGDDADVADVAGRDAEGEGCDAPNRQAGREGVSDEVELERREQESRAFVAIGEGVPLGDPAKEHRRLLERVGVRNLTTVGLEWRADDLLDEATPSDRSKAATEVVDGKRIEGDGRGGQHADLVRGRDVPDGARTA
jgi:hypothetical protein